MPSLCSGSQIENNLIYKRIAVALLRQPFWGARMTKKGKPVVLYPKQMAAPFPNVSFTAKSKQASFFCSRYIFSLRSVLGIKKGLLAPFLSFCGELGIRTPGPVTVNSFQDCRNRPLCQLSAANVGRETEFCKNTCNLYG